MHVCVCIYIYIDIHTHNVHTHFGQAHVRRPGGLQAHPAGDCHPLHARARVHSADLRCGGAGQRAELR